MPPDLFPSDPVRWDRFPNLAAHELARKQLVIEAALGLTENTLEAYGRAREDFFRFCTACAVSPTDATRKVTAVRLFFDFVADQGRRTINPVATGLHAPGRSVVRTHGLIRRHRKLPWIPSDDQWRALVNAVASEPIRNRLMFCLAYDSALRREELWQSHTG
jgi:site-specific recombinase XerD